MDVFAPVLDKRKHWGWHLLSSGAYVDASPPEDIATYWLHPAKKQGPILEIFSGNGAPGVSTEHTLFVWNHELEENYDASDPQRFDSGGTGGGNMSITLDQVDTQGATMVTSVDSYDGKINHTTRYHWNGDRFIPEAAK